MTTGDLVGQSPVNVGPHSRGASSTAVVAQNNCSPSMAASSAPDNRLSSRVSLHIRGVSSGTVMGAQGDRHPSWMSEDRGCDSDSNALEWDTSQLSTVALYSATIRRHVTEFESLLLSEDPNKEKMSVLLKKIWASSCMGPYIFQEAIKKKYGDECLAQLEIIIKEAEQNAKEFASSPLSLEATPISFLQQTGQQVVPVSYFSPESTIDGRMLFQSKNTSGPSVGPQDFHSQESTSNHQPSEEKDLLRCRKKQRRASAAGASGESSLGEPENELTNTHNSGNLLDSNNADERDNDCNGEVTGLEISRISHKLQDFKDDGIEDATDEAKGRYFTERDMRQIRTRFESSGETIAVELIALTNNIGFHLECMFDPPRPNLDGIRELAKLYFRTYENLRGYSTVYSSLERLEAQLKADRKAEEMMEDLLPDSNEFDTIAALLNGIKEDGNDEEHGDDSTNDGVIEELHQLHAKLKGLEDAIRRHGSKVNKSTMEDIVKVGNTTRNTISHLLNMALQHSFHRLQTVKELLSDPASYNRAVALARTIELLCDETTTIAKYHELVIIPALSTHSRGAAVGVACDICGSTTQKRSSHQNETMFKKYRPGELQKLSGGCCTSGARYCSDPVDKLHRRRRKRMCNTYWLISLAGVIEDLIREDERTLEAKHISAHGCTSYLLRLAPSFIERKCSFMLDRNLLCDHHISDKDSIALNKLTKKANKSFDTDSGLKFVIIDSKQQVANICQLCVSSDLV